MKALILALLIALAGCGGSTTDDAPDDGRNNDLTVACFPACAK